MALFQIIAHDIYNFDLYMSSVVLVSATIGQLLGSMFASFYCFVVQKLLLRLKIDTLCSLRAANMLLLLCLVFLFVGIGLYAQSVFLFSLFGFLTGICLGLFSPINAALLTNTISVENAAIANFLRRVMLNFGSSIAFVLISLLIDSPAVLFYSVALIFFCFGLLQVSRLGKKAGDSDAAKIHSKSFILPNKAIKDRNISKWLLATLITYIIFFQTISAYPVYLQNYAGVSAKQFSQYMILSTVIIFTLQFISPLLERKYSKNLLSMLSVVLVFLGIWMVTLGNMTMIIVMSVVIWSIGEIFVLGVTPLYAKVFSQGCSQKNLSYNSAYYMVCYIGKAVGPVVGSAIMANSTFGYFVTLLVLTLVACLLFMKIDLTGFCRKVDGSVANSDNIAINEARTVPQIELSR
ncbi:MFS transporter [Shewanella surugensis]|uniref:MFS transporter n=1 Tax=Shewanella surugensis TaxID=212020 RepID=A0ABT0LI96_9GAMM|nr:MFS transporter [Shewanella surugensis]